MNNQTKIFSFEGKKIAALFFAFLILTAFIYSQDKPKAHSHNDEQTEETCPQDGSHDHSKMDHSNHKKVDAKMSYSQESASKSCCSSESTTIKDAKAETEKPWNVICPVMGNEIDPEVNTVEYKEKTIGFCCPGCIDKFSKDPEKYMRKLSADGKKKISS